ncbi:hypothetical protein [Ruegeria sp. SCP11]|uniref:hypothetical protein n=1 Tax=Ruegeria sp. SCP11 TaxID=3141378 RepID=UPI00333C122E
MTKFSRVCASGVVGALILSSQAIADTKLTLRGGYGTSFSDYPYAYDNFDQSVIESDYGSGFYGHIALTDDAMFGSLGGEISFTYNRLTDDDDYDDGDRCSTFDVISLSHSLCMNGAETENTTRFGQFRIMATHEYPDQGVQVLGGVGVLDFSSKSDGMMFYPGESSDQHRSNDFTGIGLLLGARKSFQLRGQTSLQIEGIAGVYSGNRSLKINDEWVGNIGELAINDQQTVYSLDLSANVSVPAERIVSGGMFEFGVAYTRLFNVMDTSNYNPDTLPVVGNPGSVDDDVDALSVFFGLQIPI